MPAPGAAAPAPPQDTPESTELMLLLFVLPLPMGRPSPASAPPPLLLPPRRPAKLSDSLCDFRSCCCGGTTGNATGTATPAAENDVLEDVHVDEDDAEASVEVTCLSCREEGVGSGGGRVFDEYGDADDADETELEKSVFDEFVVENDGFFIDERRGGGC